MCSEEEAARVIQAGWRAEMQRRQMLQVLLIDGIRQARAYAAVKIQSSWRRYISWRHYYYLQLVKEIHQKRYACATVIQKHVRSYYTRRFVDEEYTSTIIRWNCSKSPTRNASVIGDFTHPKWQVAVKLSYCPIRDIYYAYIIRTNRVVSFVFIVNGKFHLSPEYPIQDKGKNQTNVIHMSCVPWESPYMRCRKIRLGQNPKSTDQKTFVKQTRRFFVFSGSTSVEEEKH